MKEKLKVIVPSFALAVMSVPIFAESTAAETAMQTAMSSAGDSVTSMIMVALPIGLGLMATILAIKKGIGFFKGLVKNAG